MALRRQAPPIVITLGDPAGIGAEVILKAAATLAQRKRVPRIVVIGDVAAMTAAARRLKHVPAPIDWHRGEALPPLPKGLPIMSVGTLSAGACRPGRPSVEGGDAAYRYIVEAARMAMQGEAAAVVTAPISKEWMNRAGHRFPGHSELFAELAKARHWRMMFVGTELRLALVTVHIGLAKVPRALSVEGIYRTIAMLAEHLRERLGLSRPRIGVLGLNPHAGEHGLFGSEEQRIIEPAIRRAQRSRIAAFGPLAPDTAFGRIDGKFRFDAAVAMYHDQGLIALKTIDFDRAVNVTLGLPFVRTSPDHGTAFDIAGGNRASAASMIAAIDYAWQASAI
jgi:4-hydroxythreonine-4-phosphate dehydrogenase